MSDLCGGGGAALYVEVDGGGLRDHVGDDRQPIRTRDKSASSGSTMLIAELGDEAYHPISYLWSTSIAESDGLRLQRAVVRRRSVTGTACPTRKQQPEVPEANRKAALNSATCCAAESCTRRRNQQGGAAATCAVPWSILRA